MLVLSRKKDEGILIKGQDGDIRVVVVDVHGGRIRLGIEAPRGCTILRQELVGEIENANKLSAIADLTNIKGVVDGP